jgi:ABC-type polysaccharide/polyol phosphate transport system ATPase subunit
VHQPAIEILNLTKTFKLYSNQKDQLLDYILPFTAPRYRPFTALEPLSLDIPHGEVFGIIGKNGSGKSTLFKILASVMSPTNGSFTIHGKLTALLELSAGFNKDLNGIENLYYLGAIQGIRREEMEEKMEDIIRFAELGDYMYQPIRMYSSGMQSRLAFSMAVHVDPEILISDEVLSVGDVRFQQKCHRRIREMKEMGKTILLCTHNLGAVREFCDRALWLHEGKMMAIDNAKDVCDAYEQFMLLKTNQAVYQKGKGIRHFSGTQNHSLPEPLSSYIWTNFESGTLLPVHFQMASMTEQNLTKTQVSGGETIRLSFGVFTDTTKESVELKITINGKFGIPLLILSNQEFNENIDLHHGHINLIHVDFTIPFLTNGTYTINAELFQQDGDDQILLANVYEALAFLVKEPEQRNNQKAQLRVPHASFHTDFCSIS